MHVESYSDRWFLDVVKLVENFHAEALGEYDTLFSPQALIETITTAQHDNAFCLIVDNVCQGLIYGQITTSSFSGQTMFQEVIWYVNKDHRASGISLLRHAEKALKEKGVSIMIMVALANSKSDKLGRFYERLGYKPMETHYVRNI